MPIHISPIRAHSLIALKTGGILPRIKYIITIIIAQHCSRSLRRRRQNPRPMAKIETIAVATVRVPLDNVTSFATRTVSARDYGLVKVCAGGFEGIGFCYAGSSGGTLVAHAVEQLLASGLLGHESLLVEGLWQRMFEETLLHGRAGSVMRAISILDCALWDLNSRASKLPLYKYLGAVLDEAVPAYASGGYYLPGKTPKKLGEEMASYAKAGFRAVKMKVGRLSPKEEIGRAHV